MPKRLAVSTALIAKLAQGIPLPLSNRDHELTGNYAGHRECHIQPDWLLIYRIENAGLSDKTKTTHRHNSLYQ
ncbi:MAG: type II toxin-antitoxin system YafQ family toxin [Bacillota bacterium]|jgi:mRNA interferase YafQ